jgi:hypothetical protein
VFDINGRLTGLALPGKPGTPDLFLTSSLLRKEMRKAKGESLAAVLGASPPTSAENTRASVDRIYEASLKSSLQLIAAP